MGLNDFTSRNTDDANNGGGISGGNGGGFGGFAMPSSANNQDDPSEYVEEVTINYNERFQLAPETLFRDEIIAQTMGVLICKNKPNAILIGSAGVGKTKIVEDIARRLANDDITVPDELKGYTIFELPLSNVMAGSGIVGVLEEKIQAIVEYFENPKNKAILFIDEIHQLAGQHIDSQYEKIAQILKPALARGDLRVIGATTSTEAKDLNEDPAFNRRFSRIIVDELTPAQTVEVLKKASVGFFNHYNNNIVINDNVIEQTVAIADTFMSTGSHRPDNALTLFDRTCGDAVVARKNLEQQLANDPNMAQALQALQANPMINITEKQLKTTAMKLATGHAKAPTFNEDTVKAFERIKGQDEIVADIISKLERRDKKLYPQKTPLALMFAGPSGVGKSEIARIIANEITNQKPIVINMPEFHSSADINRLIGSPLGYVGSTTKNELPFDCLESNPYRVILLDEFEKAHPAVQRLFMEPLEQGTLKTARGQTIDFSRTIIIATTNAGNIDKSKSIGFGFDDNLKPNVRKRNAIDKLEKWFNIELLNRFDEVYEFNRLDKDVYREILRNKYATDITRIKSEYRKITLPDEIPEEVLDELVDTTFLEEFGARPAERAIQNFIEENAFTWVPATTKKSKDKTK